MMAKRFAVRTLRLCTKDCLCLYVCPTGATDTENSIIDIDKCIGCGECANACPSHAISMVVEEMPRQQEHTDPVIAALNGLTAAKADEEQLAAAQNSPLAAAIEKSSRIMAEDLLRESGYMLPQSKNTRLFLEELKAGHHGPDFPSDTVDELLRSIPFHD